jgi:hypothetical protein
VEGFELIAFPKIGSNATSLNSFRATVSLPTLPYSSAFATGQTRPDIAAVEIGCKLELGSFVSRIASSSVLNRNTGATRPKVFFRGRSHVRCGVHQHRRFGDVRPIAWRLPLITTSGAPLIATFGYFSHYRLAKVLLTGNHGQSLTRVRMLQMPPGACKATRSVRIPRPTRYAAPYSPKKRVAKK